MFLTLGMTADAAAAHRHEFSAPRPSSPSASRQPVPSRSSFSRYPSSALRGAAMPARNSPLRPASAGSAESAPSVKFSEREPEVISDDGMSTSTLTRSHANAELPKRTMPRSRMSFQIAHPPPIQSHKQMLRIRPRLLLQLQQLSTTARPKPAFDVLPSAIYVPRLARRFPRVFRGRDGLGPNDLVIVSSDEYDSSTQIIDEGNSDSDHEGWGSREVIATICQLRREEGGGRGRAEICLNQGPAWEATPLASGGYEFVAIEEDGRRTTARWVPRIPASRRKSNTLQNRASGNWVEEERKFNFSLINPNLRRHPIIASMNRNTIDILDHFPSPSTSNANHPPTSPICTPSSVFSGQSSFFDLPVSEDRVLIPTDERLRALIVVTGIWVAFRENWSRNFRYNDAMASVASPPSSLRPSQRAASMPPSKNPESRAVTPDSQDGRDHGRHGVGGKIIHTGTNMLRHRSLVASSSVLEEPEFHGRPRRASSTGAAFMERANSRNRSSTRRLSQLPPGEQSAQSDTERSQTPRRPRPLSLRLESSTSPAPWSTASPQAMSEVDKSLLVPRATEEASLRSGSARDSVAASTQTSTQTSTQSPPDDEPRPANNDRRRWTKLKGLINIIKRSSDR
ncbi:MAG: hypothetical protein M1819_005582 [Sarea resinae]|nr:MAG: hypothetical protein M1819_005582 [Sarea resinae]